jgi:tetratricopeptide (TPR) repeat protein
MKTLLSLFGIALAGVCLADYDQASREGARQLQRGNYAAAVPQLETAVQAAESFGESDARFAAAMANLARGYFLQGRYRASEVLQRRVLVAAEKRLPAEHPEVATALSNLAEVYRYLGRIEEAAPLHRRALKIRERVHGAEDLSVAESLHHLAELNRAQRRYAEAERLYWRAVMIRSYLQGKEHPALAPSLTGLAAVNKALGREAPARELYQRAATLAEKALPSSQPRSRLHDFPELARQLEGLAEIYAAQGRLAAALELVRRVLTMREGALGALHPEVGEAYGTLARILAGLGRQDAALAAARAATLQLSTQPEKRRWEGVFLQHIALLAERSDAGALAESFATLQHLGRLPYTLELADAQKLLRSNEALLAYAVADDALYAWVVRPREAMLLKESSEERLQARIVPLVADARELLLVPHGGRHGVRPGLLARSHALTILPGVGSLAGR